MTVGPYYEFNSFRLEQAERVLSDSGKIVPLTKGEFAILLRLIEKRGQTVAKLELSKLIRGNKRGRKIDETVTRYVSRIKAKLREPLHSKNSKYIQTVSKKGYRFVYPDVHAGGDGAIAVLPFKNIGVEKPELDLGSALAEFLRRSLINRKRFPVVPGSELDAPDAKQMNQPPVKFIVSGGLMVTGRRVLVLLYVKRKDDELALKAPSYREKHPDVIQSLERIAETAADEVTRIVASEQGESELESNDTHSSKRIHTSNEEAHKFYEEGWAFLNRRTPDGLLEALAYFKRAVRKDPSFAEAHAGIADCNLLLSIFGSEVIPPRKAMPRAKKAALRALEIDETLSEAHASLAAVMFLYERDWSGSEMEFKAAIRNNPEYATARQFYSHNLALMGRIDEALAEIRTAQRLRHSPIIDATVSRIYFLGRKYSEAIEAADFAIKRYRQFFLGYVHLGIAYKQLGRFPEAIELLTKARELGGTPQWGNPAIVGELGHALAVAGRTAAAKRTIRELQVMSARQYVAPISLAKVYMGLGNLNRSFELLEQTYRDRSAWLLTLRRDPLYDEIRDLPRFQSLLRRIGLP